MLPSEEIKEKINIVDLIGEYVPLKKAGVNFRVRCPFHEEKTPSFMVSPTKQIWHCFGCGIGGDIFEFIKQSEGVEFPEALQILASRAGVVLKRPTVEYQKEIDQKKTLLSINELAAKYYAKVLAESHAAEAAREYLQRRGFKPETILAWQIGYAPEDFHTFENFIVKKGFQKKEAVAAGLLIEKDDWTFFDRFRSRIMFPLFDIHGRVVGFTARILDQGNPSTGSGINIPAKYVNSPETFIYSKSHLLYGLHLAKSEIRKLGEVIVVEGNVDVITCHEAGFANVVGSSGTALTTKQLELLKRFTDNLSFAFDVDTAGLTATRRAVELALAQGFNVKIISIPKALAKDPDELIRKDPALWQEQVRAAKNFLDFYFDAVFANIDLATNLGKKQAVAELLPLIKLLPDPIDRSHYVQKLAAKVSVEEKIILDLLNKLLTAKAPGAGSSEKPPLRAIPQSREERLERRVLGLMLKFSEDFRADWEAIGPEDFSTPPLREIFLNISPLVKSGEYQIRNLQKLDPKIAAEAELLVFAIENELSLTPDLNLDELKRQLFSDLKLLNTRRKMQELTKLIRSAEQVGRLEEVKSLSAEFNNLTRELAKHHVAEV